MNLPTQLLLNLLYVQFIAYQDIYNYPSKVAASAIPGPILKLNYVSIYLSISEMTEWAGKVEGVQKVDLKSMNECKDPISVSTTR